MQLIKFVCEQCNTWISVPEQVMEEGKIVYCPICQNRTITNEERKLRKAYNNSKDHYLDLYQKGLSIQEIAKEIGVRELTVRDNLLKLYVDGRIEKIDFAQVSKENSDIILNVMRNNPGMYKKKDIKALCPESVSYDDIAIVMAVIERKNKITA